MNSDISGDEYRGRGLWTRIKETVFSGDELEDEYDELDGQPASKKPVTLRLQSSRVSYVSVRQPSSFEDARIAADGLKDGRQQIVNLEKTTPEMYERIIDFLNGVTYALNGFVEKVGDHVYLFAPSNVVIDVQEDLNKGPAGIFDYNA
ncbi:MAG: cell division protein SepF [Armatimonadota bacterium]